MRATIDIEKRILELDDGTPAERMYFHLDFLSIFAQAPPGTIIRLDKRDDGVVTITRMRELEKAIAESNQEKRDAKTPDWTPAAPLLPGDKVEIDGRIRTVSSGNAAPRARRRVDKGPRRGK
jgi:hypothetical protein